VICGQDPLQGGELQIVQVDSPGMQATNEHRAEERLLSQCFGLRCWLDRDDAEAGSVCIRRRLSAVLGEHTSRLLLQGLAGT
jgi:hypothetical protein